MAKRKSRKKKYKDGSGIFIPAGALLGVGIGLLIGQPGPGVLIGLGVGFVAMALTQILRGK